MNKRPPLLAGLGLWALALFALVLLIVLYRLGSAISDEGRHRVENYTNELAALDLTINLNLMKLQHRQKLDYDGLVNASQRIGELLDLTEQEFDQFQLKEALAPVRQSWQQKSDNIDAFKRMNSIFSTSQYHFVNLAEELSQKQDSLKLSQVSRRLHAFLMQGGNEDLPLLVGSIYQLDREIDKWPESTRKTGKLLVAHGTLILGQYRQIQQVSRDLLDSPFTATVAAAHRVYNEAHQRADSTAANYRKAMAGFALLLVGIAILALFRLGQSTRALQRSHRLLDRITENLGEGILAFDRAGQLRFINKRASELLGYSQRQLMGRTAQSVLFHDSEADTGSPVLAAIQKRESFAGEDWLNTDYDKLPVALIGAALPEDGEGSDNGGYVLSFRDLTESRRTQARLHLASHVFDCLGEAMVITDQHGRIQFVNPAYTLITGFSEQEALGRRPGDLLGSGLHDATFFADMWRSLRDNGQWKGEIINRRKNGRRYTEWLSISAVRDNEGRVIQYVGLFSDITERKEAEAHIHHLAYHDPLTGLANRLLFRDRLDTALRQSVRNRRPLGVLILDLDRFKVVNDTLGHEAGDHLLVEVAQRMSATVRECDTLARLGGDEFALLMPEIRNADDAISVARKLLLALQPEITLGNQEVFATTSVGIAVFPEHGETGELLLRNADVALYAAKSAGRNTWQLFEPEGESRSCNRLEMEAALRHALERKELLLHYQLQLAADSSRISGAEALIRWQHPKFGLVPPDRFIPLAEQTGLIESIGAWVLREACTQLVAWNDEGVEVPRIAVNVSARQLRAAGFTEQVMAIVRETGISPSQLELELTESMLTENTEQTFAIFSELRSHGIRISIDDFGTGYSSLNYLAQFPVDVLKIDRSFVQTPDSNKEGSYVVQAIVLLAQGMNLETVAEGVETEEQRARLEMLGCNHLQGFLLARPQPPDILGNFVRLLSEKPPPH